MQQALHELTNAGFVTRQTDNKKQYENKQQNNPPRDRNKPNTWQNQNPFRPRENFRNKQNFQPNRQTNFQQGNFRPNYRNNDRYSQNFNQNYNPNNYQQKPQRFEPMDVDNSAQYRQTTQNQQKTNYVNEQPYEEANFQLTASEDKMDFPLLN